MRVVIVKYNAGNTQSLLYALERLGIEALVSDEAETLRGADKVIFPGVGEAHTAMRYLRDKGLDRILVSLQQPFLGICLGMQLMCHYSEENDTTCLGIFEERVRRFTRENSEHAAYKIPHMGWNTLQEPKAPLFEQLPPESYVYFVHSYYVEPGVHTSALCQYTQAFSAGIRKDNFYAVQFHPEKSGVAGGQILENFLKL